MVAPATMRRLCGSSGVRIIAFVLIGVIATITVISLAGPSVDLSIARLFFDPVARRFPTASYATIAMLRDHGFVAIVTCVGFVVAAVATHFSPQRRLKVSAHAAIFLVSTLALGPGLLVNVVLKDHWHRPRPVQVTEFGGDKSYVDWWDPRGTCDRNCSFAGGEASSAAWMFGPAMLAPPPWRPAALATAAVFTAAVSLSRMAVGGHFFSDVLFGALISILVVWALHALIIQRRTP